jgi:hypothetical protein
MDNLNPDWHAQFVIEYLFGEIQTLNVKVYDEDRRGSVSSYSECMEKFERVI